jgi:hypothetical protein
MKHTRSLSSSQKPRHWTLPVRIRISYLYKAAFPLVQLRMRRGNSMQEERHAQNGCARGRRKVTHVSRSQTGRYVRVFASFRLLVHVFLSDRLTVFLRTGMPQAA